MRGWGGVGDGEAQELPTTARERRRGGGVREKEGEERKKEKEKLNVILSALNHCPFFQSPREFKRGIT